jgi:hypothetical protein
VPGFYLTSPLPLPAEGRGGFWLFRIHTLIRPPPPQFSRAMSRDWRGQARAERSRGGAVNT